MKYLLIILCLNLSIVAVHGQQLSGLWKGSMYANGTNPSKGYPVYFEFDISKSGEITGKSRNEKYNTNDFAIKNLKGNNSSNSLTINETVVTKKSSNIKITWCRYQFQLTYNPETGYITGTYTSNDCKNQIGKLVLYREEGTFPAEQINPESHHWFDLLVKDLTKGLNAPEIRKKERENFVFQPIYFDYDKSEIKDEFHDFLNRMIKVLEGHSDLRVKVTGHTDSDGSDEYNIGLSKRRAQAIIDYFVGKGLSADRLEFDFKGERAPVDSNATSEGRQRNRRVDFEFI